MATEEKYMGLMDKFKNAQAIQETSETKKKEAETIKLVQEQKRSELSTERDRMMEELKQSEQDSAEATSALAEVDKFISEKGTDMDPAAKSEMEAIKIEANEILQKYNEMKDKIESLNAEISSFEQTEKSQTQEVKTESNEQKSLNDEIKEIEKEKINEKQNQANHANEISIMSSEKKKEYLEKMIEENSLGIFNNPDILKQLNSEELMQLNRKRNFNYNVDATLGGEVLSKMQFEGSERNKIKRSSEEFLNTSNMLPFNKNLYAMKYAEMFSLTPEGFNGKIFKEGLQKFMNIPKDIIETRTEISKRIENKGLLGLGKAGNDQILQLLKSKAFSANMFKDKSLFEQLRDSKKNIKEYSKEKNGVPNDLISLYVDMKNENILTNEQFKELTKVE